MSSSAALEAPVPNIIDDSWSNLRVLIRALEQDGSTLGNIRDALEQFYQLKEAHEMFENTWNKNGTTRPELEILFQRLRENCARSAWLGMTGCVKGLCRDVRVELAYIRYYSLLRPSNDNRTQADDSIKLLKHYLRIQFLLQALVLNTDPSICDVLSQDTESKTHPSGHGPTRPIGPDSCTHLTDVRWLHSWIQNSAPGTVSWVPDARKMGISHALCAELATTHKLAASFFVTQEHCDFNSIIPSIACQLADYSTPFQLASVHSRPPAFDEPLEVQFEELIANPLAKVRAALPAGLALVIDVSNGCASARPIIDAILAKSEGLPIKFFIFSRSEPYYDAAERLFVREVGGGPVINGVEGEMRTALKPFGFSELLLGEFVQRAGVLFTCAAAAAHHVSNDTPCPNSSPLVDG